MGERLFLPRAVYEEIVAHAREGYPEEVCGLISGKKGHATALYRARNIADERHENYAVDPQTLLKQVDFEERGEALLAIYHSHPVSPPYPSATDARQAYYPDVVYIIVSLQNRLQPEMRGWRLVQGEAQQVDEIPDDATRVRGRRDFAARHVVLGPGRARYDLWWQDDKGDVWHQEVAVEEVVIEVEDGKA